jgi:hypothetical protein
MASVLPDGDGQAHTVFVRRAPLTDAPECWCQQGRVSVSGQAKVSP